MPSAHHAKRAGLVPSCSDLAASQEWAAKTTSSEAGSSWLLQHHCQKCVVTGPTRVPYFCCTPPAPCPTHSAFKHTLTKLPQQV
jgi:hypothetical protein